MPSLPSLPQGVEVRPERLDLILELLARRHLRTLKFAVGVDHFQRLQVRELAAVGRRGHLRSVPNN